MPYTHRNEPVPPNHSEWARGRRLAQSVRGTDTFIDRYDYDAGKDYSPKTFEIPAGLHSNVKSVRGLSIAAIEDLRKRASTHPDTAMISLSDDGPDYHGIRVV